MSKYDGEDFYTYQGTDILRNLANVQTQRELDEFEADATFIRQVELVSNPIPGSYDLLHLQAIHQYLFQDVYDWAGELRTVDITKGNSRFANCNLIQGYLGSQLSKLRGEHFLRNLSPQAFIERMAFYMSEINATHPFREGNGRAQRAFCSQLGFAAGYFIDFSSVSRDEMYSAMIGSFNGRLELLLGLLDRIVSQID